MADISDVCDVMAALAAQAVYPNGTGQPSITGAQVACFQGWPDPASLDADLAKGNVQVSIYPRPEERNTSRFPKDMQPLVVQTPTLALTISGQTVTVSGTVPPVNNPTNLCIEANKQAFVYPVQPSDTLTGIATALANLVAAGIAGTTSSGAVISVPATARLTAARVGVTATAIREIRRQERRVMLTVWAPTPEARKALAGAIDVAFAEIQFLTMPDTFAARIIYRGSPLTDGNQKDNLYRRDLIFTVEFATTDVITATQVTQQVTNIAPQNAPPFTLIQ